MEGCGGEESRLSVKCWVSKRFERLEVGVMDPLKQTEDWIYAV